MIAQPDENLVKERGITATTQMTQVDTEKLTKLAQLVKDGVVKPQIGKVYSLDDIVAAFKAKESDAVSGKIVVEIKK